MPEVSEPVGGVGWRRVQGQLFHRHLLFKARSIGTTWELVRNADSRRKPQV